MSRRHVRQHAAIVVVVLGLLLWIRADEGGFTARLEHVIYDSLVRSVPTTSDAVDRVTVIVVDDDSLLRLGSRWPLPRTTWAQLFDVLARHPPAVVGVDAWFEVAESRAAAELALDVVDRLSFDGLTALPAGATLADDMEARSIQLDGDGRMVRSVAALGRVILGMTCQHATDRVVAVDRVADIVPLEHPALPEQLPMRCQRLATSIAPLVSVALGQAGVQTVPIIDGVARRYAFALGAGLHAYPSLALAMVRHAEPERSEALTQRALERDDATPLLRHLPRESFRTLRFSDLLEATPDLNALDAALRDRLVLIGVSAAGTEDFLHTPIERNLPGVYVHGSAIAGLLDGTLISHSGWPPTVAVLIGLLWLLVLFGLGPRLNRVSVVLALGVGSCLAWMAVAALLLRAWYWPTTTPLLAGYLLWTVGHVLRERQAVLELFGRYVTRQVADELLSQRSEQDLAGKLQQVTILMSDLRGFTRLSRRLGPERTVAVLNRYLGRMTEVIDGCDGTINEFIGDAILVLFGAPVQGTDDAARAVTCAVAMQRALAELNDDSAELGIERLEMGIGLDTGEVVAGSIGSAQRAKYCVVGDTVNMAARIESLTVASQVLISASTAELIGGRAQLEGPLRTIVKGRPEPLEVYEVRAMDGLAMPVSARDELSEVQVTATCRPFLGKKVASESFEATVVGLGEGGALLDSAQPLQAFDDLLLVLHDDEGPFTGDIYAKIRQASEAGSGRWRLQLAFTAVGPSDLSALRQRVAAAS